jgi:hypothetical protein
MDSKLYGEYTVASSGMLDVINDDCFGSQNVQLHKYHSHKKIQQDATVYQNFILYFMKLNMCRATHHPSSGA